ncbi:phenylacetate-CoA ligase [Fontibacillus panacisegetis]|uniref:Phenylacetate-CoA ligase n=1 Tax=Fontibacillus panacisegetis TaxID=670482 RepID=A0A1G7PYU9_9BACL|nr:phenylacetate--CoA ligase family protein [Fontibacillus panacisegetis]SDF91497.1 phenylacetate-CoA ligase [Fontibacillus panacisegetis]
MNTLGKLETLFSFLRRNNHFYRDLLKKIDDVETAAVFEKLPIISKSIIRNQYDNYFSEGCDDAIEELTSGSTGVPLRCLKTISERMTASMNIWKQRKRRDPEVSFNNFINLFGEQVYKEIGNFIDTNEETMTVFLKVLLNKKPRWISAPISIIEQYARLIERGKVEYREKCIHFIEFFGEYVDPEKRKYIESIFNCTTINHYGTKETWCIAYECNCGNLHLQDNLFILEQIPTNLSLDNPNIGELVVTSLFNKLMPFVRYNLQDLGTIETKGCDCGSKSPVITLYGGRTGDILKGTNMLGNNLFNRILNRLMKCNHDVVDGFRVEQYSLNHIVIFIVKGPNYTHLSEQLLLAFTRSELGNKIHIDLRYVDEIPRLPSGKIKNFHSYI